MNTIKKRLSLITIIGLLFLSLIISNVYAQESNDLMADIANQNVMFGDEAGLEYQDPEEAAINIINTVLGFIGLFFLVMVIYSGFQWMTSGGNEEKITKARRRLINSVIGIVIILCSYIIANWIMTAIQEPADAGWWNL